MKKFTSIILSGLVVVGATMALTLASTDAAAQARGAGARGSAAGARAHVGGVRAPVYHGSRVGARVGVVVGAPFIGWPWWGYPYPYYYGYGYGYPPYYYPPGAYVQEQPPVYVERPAPAPAPQAPSAPQAQPEQYWYYCQDSKTYYPYVQKCATPWQRVMPHAPQ